MHKQVSMADSYSLKRVMSKLLHFFHETMCPFNRSNYAANLQSINGFGNIIKSTLYVQISFIGWVVG